jgi:DNA-binding CsgD family transcriptional regulator
VGMQPDYSALVLDLYRGAQSIQITDFPSFAIEAIKRAVDFDMALFGLGSLSSDDKVTLHYGHLHNDPPPALDEWLSFLGRDKIIRNAMRNPGQSFYCHVPEFFTGRENADILDYVHRRNHRNVMALTIPYGPNQIQSGISLRRADPKWRFDHRDQRALETIMPHVCEAFRINRTIFSQKLLVHAAEPIKGICIFDPSGVVVYQDSTYMAIAKSLLPEFDELKAPRILRESFSGGEKKHRTIGTFIFSAKQYGKFCFLSVRPKKRIDALTEREAEIARYYGTGLTYKEIGVELLISPSTVRRHIESIYVKLKVNTKADLAYLVHESAPRHADAQ